MSDNQLARLRFALAERGHEALAETLRWARMRSWAQEEPDERLAPLGDWFASSYPALVDVVEIEVCPGTLDDFDTDSQVALDAALAATLEGELGYWRIYEGDREDWEIPPQTPLARPSTWNGMSFRSQSERRVAEALDRASVAFYANARGRIGATSDARENRETDLLVIHRGKLGIIEIDGPTHDGRAADDHERDRAFRHHGIQVIERFSAHRAFNMPDDLVAEFLVLLAQNG